MRLDDWGRMGRLLLDGTGADGAQVIAPDWLAFMKAPSPRDPAYGGQTWLNRADGSDSDGPTLFPAAAPDTVVSMIGHPCQDRTSQRLNSIHSCAPRIQPYA